VSNATFSDSIDNNLELLRELLRGLPPDTRNQARLAASVVEKTILAIQKDTQGNQGAALGAAFAIYTFAQRMVEGGKGKNLIELLN
jgi:hypothetical protein